MEINKEKVDEITLAPLYLTTFKDRHGLRALKATPSGHVFGELTARPGAVLRVETALRVLA